MKQNWTLTPIWSYSVVSQAVQELLWGSRKKWWKWNQTGSSLYYVSSQVDSGAGLGPCHRLWSIRTQTGQCVRHGTHAVSIHKTSQGLPTNSSKSFYFGKFALWNVSSTTFLAELISFVVFYEIQIYNFSPKSLNQNAQIFIFISGFISLQQFSVFQSTLLCVKYCSKTVFMVVINSEIFQCALLI